MAEGDEEKGLYERFDVQRLVPHGNARSEPCSYFVLDYEHDPYALDALLSYAEACEIQYPALSRDLRALVNERS